MAIDEREPILRGFRVVLALVAVMGLVAGVASGVARPAARQVLQMLGVSSTRCGVGGATRGRARAAATDIPTREGPRTDAEGECSPALGEK